MPRASRKPDILQALARMLEHGQGKKITTANLAEEVGLSEAALYRHFPSKAKMFEALIDFAEESVFSRIKPISSEAIPAHEKCSRIITLLLVFAERNPGISRLLAGDALLGEEPRLLQRIQQLFSRCETQLKQILREAEYQNNERTTVSAAVAANLMVTMVEGKIRQYIRTDFTATPMAQWPEQWPVIQQTLFVDCRDPSIQ